MGLLSLGTGSLCHSRLLGAGLCLHLFGSQSRASLRSGHRVRLSTDRWQARSAQGRDEGDGPQAPPVSSCLGPDRRPPAQGRRRSTLSPGSGSPGTSAPSSSTRGPSWSLSPLLPSGSAKDRPVLCHPCLPLRLQWNSECAARPLQLERAPDKDTQTMPQKPIMLAKTYF